MSVLFLFGVHEGLLLLLVCKYSSLLLLQYCWCEEKVLLYPDLSKYLVEISDALY